MLKLVLGRSGSGKSARLMEEVRRKRTEYPGRPIVFLVPEQYTLQCERDLIRSLDIPGTLDIQVLSMSRLAERVLGEAGGRTRILLSDPGRAMLIRKVLAEHREEMQVLKGAEEGLVSRVGDFIREISRNRLDSGDCLEAAGRVDNPYLRRKLEDLARLAAGYEEELAGRYLDSEGAYGLLLSKIPESRILRSAPVLADGFTQFTRQGLEILKALGTVAESLTLALPFDDDPAEGSLFLRQQEICRELTGHFTSAGRPVETVRLEGSGRHPEIRFLEENVFRFPTARKEGPPDNIHVYEAAGREEEVTHVLGEIRRLTVEEGMRFRDITVICNALEEYEESLTRQLGDWGIPAFVDSPRPLQGNRFVDWCLLSLEAVRDGYPRETLLALLKTGFTSLTGEQAEVLENLILARGLDRGRFLRPLKTGPKDPPEAAVWLAALMEPLTDLEKRLKEAGTLREAASSFYHWLVESGAADRLGQLQERLEEEQEYLYAGRYAQVWNILMEILDQMAGILGEDPSDPERFMSLLSAGLGDRKLGQIPTGTDQVLVGALDRSKTHDIGALFLLGFNEGLIPRSAPEDSLISGFEAEILREKGMELLPDPATRYRNEKLNTWLALAKPSERLYISYALGGQEGETLRPSPLIRRIRRIFPDLIVHSGLTDTGLPVLPGEPSGYALAELSGLWLSAAASGTPVPEEALRWLRRIRCSDPETLRKLLDTAFPRDVPVGISPELARRLYGDRLVVSVSRLEKMAACPFAHFVRYGLRPKERQILQVKPADVGNLFHGTLYRFARDLKEEGLRWEALGDDDRSRRLDRALTDCLDTPEGEAFRESGATRFLAGRLGEVLEACVTAMSLQLARGEFTPEAFEVAFGRSGALPALELELPGGTRALLEGIIDRVDLCARGETIYAKLLDYKSGAKDFDFTRFWHGLMLQLMLYLAAYTGGASGVRPAGAFYFRVDDPLMEGATLAEAEAAGQDLGRFRMTGILVNDPEVLEALDRDPGGKSPVIPAGLKKDGTLTANSLAVDPGDMDRMMDYARQQAAGLAAGILEGRAEISPYRLGKDKTPCTWCEAAGVCFFRGGSPGAWPRYLEAMNRDEVLGRLRGEDCHGVDPGTE